MNPIDALKLSSQQLHVHQKNNSFNHIKGESQGIQPSLFSTLFHSFSLDSETGSEGQKLGPLLEKSEEALQTSQGSLVLSPEEQELLAAMINLLSPQAIELKGKLQENSQVNLQPSIQQIEKVLNDLANLSTINLEGKPSFVGAEGEKNFLTPINEDNQELKQLQVFIQKLEIEQQETGKQQASYPQFKMVEQVLNHFNGMIKELETNQQLTVNQQHHSLSLNLESTRLVPNLQINLNQDQQNQKGEGQDGDRQLLVELSQSHDDIQPLPAAVHGAKGVQGAQHTEPNTQVPHVRISNLFEDLKEVIRGSLRLHATSEGTQIRVNVTPDHLGHLDIRLTASEGKIVAHIFTTSLVAKEALELQVNQLRNSLQQQGISVERIEITHQTSQQSLGQQHAQSEQRFTQQQKQGTSSRNKNAYQQIEEEVAIERSQLSDQSVKVDYTI